MELNQDARWASGAKQGHARSGYDGKRHSRTASGAKQEHPKGGCTVRNVDCEPAAALPEATRAVPPAPRLRSPMLFLHLTRQPDLTGAAVGPARP